MIRIRGLCGRWWPFGKPLRFRRRRRVVVPPRRRV
jgi:hypothetical protein